MKDIPLPTLLLGSVLMLPIGCILAVFAVRTIRQVSAPLVEKTLIGTMQAGGASAMLGLSGQLLCLVWVLLLWPDGWV